MNCVNKLDWSPNINQYFEWQQVEQVIGSALAEDLGSGDITTESLIPLELKGKGSLLIKGEGVLAGIKVAAEVFHRIEPALEFQELIHDGAKIHPGDIVATISGSAAGILKAERTALNFLQHLSGIATETAQYVEAVSGLKARILDTRKTIPGLRLLEKYAVQVGGGQNHRQDLATGILIKDNHLAVLRSCGTGLEEAIAKVRKNTPQGIAIEVEVESIEQAHQALDVGADIIMLDNMSIEDMRSVVELCQGRASLEASGGVSLANVRSIAETGVNFISIGALTHSAKALDISLELEPL
jgi:nicotinate-nucleotide pyrophosphorylase (carboxylating)